MIIMIMIMIIVIIKGITVFQLKQSAIKKRALMG